MGIQLFHSFSTGKFDLERNKGKEGGSVRQHFNRRYNKKNIACVKNDNKCKIIDEGEEQNPIGVVDYDGISDEKVSSK